MNTRTLETIVITAALAASLHRAVAQGTAFTYQGLLTDGASRAHGLYDLRFAIYDALGGGAAVTGPRTNSPVVVSNGVFSLRLDFGSGVFDGNSRWLEISVRTNGSVSPFVALVPRQAITATPYAMVAGGVPNGAITGAALAANTVGSGQLADVLDLGSSTVNGRLDIFRTTAGTVALRLDGPANHLLLFGDDGSELGRFAGQNHGLLELRDSDGHQRAVQLTANGDNGGLLTLYNSNGVSRAQLSGENVGGALSLYQADGSGVGAFLDGYDSSGAGRLELRNTNAALRALVQGGPAAGSVRLYRADGGNGVILEGHDTFGSGRLTLIENNGNVGARLIGEDGDNGAALTLNKWGGSGIIGRPASRVGTGHIWLWNTQYLLPTVEIQASENSDGDGTGGHIRMYNGDGTVNTVEIDAQRPASGGGHGGFIGLRDDTGTRIIEMDANSGVVKGKVIEITGGADFSENFDISGDAHEPGMIVSIDPASPGRLVLSASAYDKKVAGIISGAGGVRPGMLMGQRGSVADGKHPVALTGRVYCWVDADASGAIEPGDMLTTSNTAGHGMKATDASRATGAIIGKAMTRLDHGKGLVLVLVNLQ